MAVYAPGDSPADGSDGQDPGMWARLLGYVNPIGSANAATAPAATPVAQQPNAFQGAFGNIHDWLQARMTPQANAAITDPRTRALADAGAQLNAGPPLNVNAQPTLGPNNPLAKAAAIPTTGLYTSPSAPSVASSPARPGGIGSDANFPVMGAGGFPTTYAAPGQQPPVPTPRPTAQPVKPRGSGQPVVRKRPTVIPASATASVPPAGSPWTTDFRQNADVSGGALARGGPAKMGMLDLSKLFARQ